MLATHELTAAIKFEYPHVHVLLRKLHHAGWTPAAYAAEQELLRQAGVTLEASIRLRQNPYGDPVVAGDVFFSGADTYYLLFIDMEPFISEVTNSFHRVTVGLITGATEDSVERLKSFAAVVAEAAKSCVDGRRARHMNFEWAPEERGKNRLRDILEAENDGGPPQFDRAELPEHVVKAATVLAQDDFARSLMIEISKGGFIRARDIGRGRKARTEIAEQAISYLSEAGLLVSKYLLVCRHNSAEITQFDSPDELQNHGALRHAACGRPFSDELIEEGYSLSELGRSLVARSHWMTVWVAEQLRLAGVPIDAMVWNVSDSGEEVDLIVEFLEELWILELKDRNFESGDAHPFNYRRVRYEPQRAMIVTTGSVSRDAKRVFTDLHKEQSRATLRRAHNLTPQFIEGVSAVPEAFLDEIMRAESAHALRRLNPLARATGFDFRRLFKSRREALPRVDEIAKPS